MTDAPRVVGVKAYVCDFGIAFGPLYEDEASDLEAAGPPPDQSRRPVPGS